MNQGIWRILIYNSTSRHKTHGMTPRFLRSRLPEAWRKWLWSEKVHLYFDASVQIMPQINIYIHCILHIYYVYIDIYMCIYIYTRIKQKSEQWATNKSNQQCDAVKYSFRKQHLTSVTVWPKSESVSPARLLSATSISSAGVSILHSGQIRNRHAEEKPPNKRLSKRIRQVKKTLEMIVIYYDLPVFGAAMLMVFSIQKGGPTGNHHLPCRDFQLKVSWKNIRFSYKFP